MNCPRLYGQQKSALGREIWTLKQSSAAWAAPLQFCIGCARDYNSECSDQCCPRLPWKKQIRGDRCTLFLKYWKFFCYSVIIEVFALWHRGINPMFLCWLSICLCSVLKVLALWSCSSAALFFLPYYPWSDCVQYQIHYLLCAHRTRPLPARLFRRAHRADCRAACAFVPATIFWHLQVGKVK